MSEPRQFWIVEFESGKTQLSNKEIFYDTEFFMQPNSSIPTLPRKITKVIPEPAYQELQEKLKVAEEALESIIIHRISGSDVYQSSESMQLEAREALAKIRGEG